MELYYPTLHYYLDIKITNNCISILIKCCIVEQWIITATNDEIRNERLAIVFSCLQDI